MPNRGSSQSARITLLTYFSRESDFTSGLGESSRTLSESDLVDESQTQEATQNALMLAIARQTETTLKRRAESGVDKPTKKTKISIGTAVDLCD